MDKSKLRNKSVRFINKLKIPFAVVTLLFFCISITSAVLRSEHAALVSAALYFLLLPRNDV